MKRLVARKYVYIYNEPGKKKDKLGSIEYVLAKDIEELHGKAWAKKYAKIAGVNTCPVVPAQDPSHKLSKQQVGIYMHDYLRFADALDKNKPTYFD